MPSETLMIIFGAWVLLFLFTALALWLTRGQSEASNEDSGVNEVRK